MSNIPSELKYVASHEWIRVEGDGIVTIGVTDHAQDLLGDVVFVELPDVGAELAGGDEAGVVESVKAASDVYAPLSGEIVAINEELEDSPELVNSDPYGDGWFFKIKLSDTAELNDLLDAEGYTGLCESEA
ncbi:glycine cleavage system protein GcvH [Neptuniibacter pectenicola]|jgi:glycine cleavage system H protein|uniref:Glycine cleavage system H protein n=1 Tax=Neptuniibacter pectenicola TaxID=1806669 RepID=A0ABU9TTX0_9GAMM|nr:glycine cleavage system protein GcvH [Neptuniibacter pectenicola]KXJ51172.1 MAG: glycine cleavage system protein H [Neptuniibacter sp. Phe_28]|tara:strand:+ start:1014 stop:1406 length:393 start_codon:yes stop_codon:yes gene_type:complete